MSTASKAASIIATAAVSTSRPPSRPQSANDGHQLLEPTDLNPSGASLNFVTPVPTEFYENGHTPRTNYALMKARREATSLQMMMHMDAGKVRSIQNKFEGLGGSVDLEGFVGIMRKHLPEMKEVATKAKPRRVYLDTRQQNPAHFDPYAPPPVMVEEVEETKEEREKKEEGERLDKIMEITGDLVELFREVDINGDGDMEWDEFTRFIVEKASLFQDALALDPIPAYNHNTKLNTENIDVDERQRHTNTLDAICPIPKSHQFAVIEAHSKYVSLYNSFSGTLCANMYNNAVPLAICHVESERCLVTSTADMTLNVWNLDDPSAKKRYMLRSKWPTKNAQMSLAWVEAHKLLYTGGTSGSIGAWSLTERAEKAKFEGHEDIVMNMISMTGLNNIVSASLDTTVRIWDTYTGQETNKLCGHNKGVFSLSYNPEQRFVVSAGFDHDAYVWSPFVNTLLFKLTGHSSSLVGCECVPNSHELVTADSSGVFKIWDLRNFMCTQTFTSEHEAGDLNDLNGLSSFAHVKLPAGGGDYTQSTAHHNPEDPKEDYRIVCGTKRLFFFDQFRSQTEPVTDVLPITVALFNSVSLTILTAAGHNIKVWDAVLGNIKVEYNNIVNSDVTAACLDDRQRKFIIGTVTGSIGVYNYSNGALMKKFPPFEASGMGGGAVTDLVYCSHAKVVIASCVSGNIRIYDELDPENCLVLREFDRNYTHTSLAMIHYAISSDTVVSAGTQGDDMIKYFDFETGKCLGEFDYRENKDDLDSLNDGQSFASLPSVTSISAAVPDVPVVYAMVCLDHYPLLALSMSDGKIAIFGMRTAHPRIRNTKIFEFENKAPSVATYAAENDNAYPLLHMPRPEDALYKPHQVTHNTNLRRRTSSVGAADEESDDMWVTKPRFDSPRAFMPLPAHSLVWNEEEECFYTGDESGRVRKWGIGKLLKEISDMGLGEKAEKREDDQKYGAAPSASPSKSRKSMGRKSLQGSNNHDANDVSNYMPLPEFAAPDVLDFVWGCECHDDSCNVSMVENDGEKSLLTFSSDRTVKMWTLEGRPMGTLLAGLEKGTKNPVWDFKMDVDKRKTADDADAAEVFERVLKDEAELKKLGRGEKARRGDVVDGKHRLEGGGGDNVAGVNLRTIQKLREKPELHSGEAAAHKGAMAVEDELMDIWTNPGEDHDMKHVRVLTVLSNMQTMSAQGVGSGFEEGGGGVDDGEMDELERNLAKAGRNNAIKVPKGFTMSSMDSFEELGFSLTGPGAKRKSRLYGGDDEDGDESVSMGGSKGRLPILPQTYRVYKPPKEIERKSIVPPSPGRREFLSEEAKKSYGALTEKMQSWEDMGSVGSGKMIGGNPFREGGASGGASGGMADFSVKMPDIDIGEGACGGDDPSVMTGEGGASVG